jgi:hypothetical protein
MDNQTFCHRFFYAEDRYQVPAGKSIWFRGNDFFSYDTVVAQIVTGLDGNTYVLVSDHRMSPTTGKHLALIKSASPYPIIHVPMRYGESRFARTMIEGRLTAELDYLATLKMTQKTNRDAYSRAFRELETAARLLVKIKKSVLNKYRKLYTQINDPERIAKEKRHAREAAVKQHQKLKKELETLVKSRNIAELAELAYGKSTEVDVVMKNKLRKLINPSGDLAFAWREGGHYKTSKGITVSAKEVERVARVFKAGELRHGDKLALYTVCSITDKAVKIGCHLIPMDNIRCLIG